MRATPLSTNPRASIAPIGTMKLASRNRNSGSTSSAARHRSARPLRASARRSSCGERWPEPTVAAIVATTDQPLVSAPVTKLLRDPGVETLVELVEVLQPELVVDRQRA